MKLLFARVLRASVLLASLVAVSDDALAQQRPPPTSTRTAPPAAPAPVNGPVAVEVLCVRATNSNSRVDPKLERIVSHLKFTRYTGFDLIDSHSYELSPKEEATFPIEGGRKVKLELLERDGDAAKVRIQMFSDSGSKQLDTTVQIHRNRSFMVAGPKVGDDVLILPVTVRY